MAFAAVVAFVAAGCGLDAIGSAPVDGGAAPPGSRPEGGSGADGGPPGEPPGDGGADADAGPKPQGPFVTITRTDLAASATVDLTAEGALDWVCFQPGVRKATASAAFGALVYSGVVNICNNFPWTLTWSDGSAPNQSFNGKPNCYYDINGYFTFDVQASTKRRTLTFLAGVYAAHGQLTAKLSDGSASQVDATLDNSTNVVTATRFTVDFAASSNAVKLGIEWRDISAAFGSVVISAVALRE